MKTFLHIDASVRKASNLNPEHDSISKRIAMQFVEQWKTVNPIDEYIYRDIGVNPRTLSIRIGSVLFLHLKRGWMTHNGKSWRYPRS